MRIHLRHTQTGQLVQSPNSWTDDPEMAYDFRFPDRAREFAQTWEITEVELEFETEPAAREPIVIHFTPETPLSEAA